MKLFTVGPVMMYPETMNIAGKQLPYFRTEEFSRIVLTIEQKIKEVVNAKTDSKVALLTASGTGAMESVIMNSFDETDRLLIINGGSFGNRFCELAQIHHIPYDAIDIPFGEELTEEKLFAIDGSQYTAFVVNHHETSTGQLYDIKMIQRYCQKYQLFLIVDAISSFLADSISMDEDGISCLILSSQKALALNPGLSIVVVNSLFYERKIKNRPPKGMYLDLNLHFKNMERGQTPNTPAVGVILELADRLEKLDYQKEMEEIKKRANYFRERASKLEVILPNYPLSNALTPIILPKQNATAIFEILKRQGLMVTPSGGDLKDKVLRIGHLGNLTLQDYDQLLMALEKIMKKENPGA